MRGKIYYIQVFSLTKKGAVDIDEGIEAFVEEKIPISFPLLVGNEDAFSLIMDDRINLENPKHLEINASTQSLDINLQKFSSFLTTLISIETTGLGSSQM